MFRPLTREICEGRYISREILKSNSNKMGGIYLHVQEVLSPFSDNSNNFYLMGISTDSLLTYRRVIRVCVQQDWTPDYSYRALPFGSLLKLTSYCSLLGRWREALAFSCSASVATQPHQHARETCYSSSSSLKNGTSFHVPFFTPIQWPLWCWHLLAIRA